MDNIIDSKKRTRRIVQFSMLLAIEAIVCFTPLGSLPAIGPIVATLGMVPVIITAILLGTKLGTLMGFFAGLFSFLVWTFMPPSPIAFVFTPFYKMGELGGNAWSLVICFVPRILVGTVTGVCFNAMKDKCDGNASKEWLSYGLSAAAGSMTNTLLVMLGIFVFFGQSYATAVGVVYDVLLAIIGTTILTSGIPEAVVSAVAAYFVCRPLYKRLSGGH